jgi:hypothetical protein
MTYYTPGTGACGIVNTEEDMIVAISKETWDLAQNYVDAADRGNPNKNPLCNQKIQLQGKDGTMHTVTITDRCYACTPVDLDTTPGLYAALGGTVAEGHFNTNWAMV